MIPMHRWYKRKRHRWPLGKGWWESTGRPGLVSYPQVFLPWAPMGQSSTSFCRTEESFWIIIREKWGEGDLTPSHGAYFAKLQRGRHSRKIHGVQLCHLEITYLCIHFRSSIFPPLFFGYRLQNHPRRLRYQLAYSVSGSADYLV